MHLKHKICSLTVGLLCMLPWYSVEAGVAIIANPAVTATSLTPDQVSDIFLGKTRIFPTGEKVIPVDQGLGSTIRNDFYTKVLKKSESEMKSYWSRVLFTGKGRPPLQQDNDATVKALVAKNPTILGYIDSLVVDDTVKVLLLVQ